MDDRKQQARDISKRARELAQSLDRSPIEMGVLAYEAKKHTLYLEVACKSYEQWAKKFFGKQRKTAERYRRIYEKLSLTGAVTREDLLEIGNVKSYELCRLPESTIRKGEWLERAKKEDTETFKKSVEAELTNKPDHQEKLRKWGFLATDTQILALDRGLKKAMEIAETDNKAEATEYVFADFIAEYGDSIDEEENVSPSGHDVQTDSEGVGDNGAAGDGHLQAGVVEIEEIPDDEEFE